MIDFLIDDIHEKVSEGLPEEAKDRLNNGLLHSVRYGNIGKSINNIINNLSKVKNDIVFDLKGDGVDAGGRVLALPPHRDHTDFSPQRLRDTEGKTRNFSVLSAKRQKKSFYNRCSESLMTPRFSPSYLCVFVAPW